jgi:hypothetical protein
MTDRCRRGSTLAPLKTVGRSRPGMWLAGFVAIASHYFSSFTARRFSLAAKHEGETVRYEKTLAGGLDPPVVYSYQIRFLQLF